MLECGSGGDSYVGTESGSDFNIRTNNTIHTTFLNGGNVGIGETLPTQKIHFKGSSTTYALAETTGSGTSSGFRMKAGASADYTLFTTQGTNQFAIYNNVTSTQPLTVDSSGNIGLGTAPTVQNSLYRAINLDVNNFYSIVGHNASACEGNLIWNAYSTGNETFAYKGTGDQATRFRQAGTFRWEVAGVGTAGNPVSFVQAMTLSADGVLQVGRTSGSAGDGKLQTGATGTGAGAADTKLGFALIEDDSGNGAGLWLGAMTNQNTGVIGSRTASGNIAFQTYNGGWGERMRLTYQGNLLVGTTSITDANQALLVLQSAYPKTRMEIRNDGQTSALYAITFRNGNGLVGDITTSGSATSFNTSSDYRLKNTIAPMTGALAKVALLKPCTYKWNADGSDGQGFIAHELQEVVEGCVTGEKDAVDAEGNPRYQGVDTSFLVATLTAAIQEQQAIITQLTARITALEET